MALTGSPGEVLLEAVDESQDPIAFPHATPDGRVFAALGRMPSSHAYYTWAAERRRRAKETGALARYPSRLTVEHHVGHWAEVTRAAEELLGGPSRRRARGGEGAVGG